MRLARVVIAVGLVALFSVGPDAEAQVSALDSLIIRPSTYNISNEGRDTNFQVPVILRNEGGLGAIALPLTYQGHPELRIDTTVTTGGERGITLGPAGRNPSWLFATTFIDAANKGILIGFITFGVFPPAYDTLCYVHFDLDSSAQSGVVILDSGVVNNQRLRLTSDVAEEFIPTWVRGVINIGEPRPTIEVDPTAVDFDGIIGAGNPPAQDVAIRNTGAGTLHWSAVASAPWLLASPGAGTGDGSISVSVNTAGLAAGTHTGAIVVSDPTASNSPESVQVALILTKPDLFAAPVSLSFTAQSGGANPAPRSLTLSATGGAAIGWTAASSSAWLEFAPTSGNTPNTISIAPNITGLPGATYYDTLLVTSANAGNSPLAVPVTLFITQPPAIALSRDSVNFTALQDGSDPPPEIVRVTNAGTGTLNITAATDQPWLSVAPGSGAVPLDLEITSSISGLTAGTHIGHVIISAAAAVNSPESVAVTLVVQPPAAVLEVSPSSATFTATEGDTVGTPEVIAVVIANTGGGVLNYSITGLDSAWARVSKLSGTAPDTLEISVQPTALSANSYQETFEIVAPGAVGSPVLFTVTLNVSAGPPAIGLTPGEFEFTAIQGGGNPPIQVLSVSNVGGGGPLNWTAVQTEPWLSVTPSSGTAPSQITLSIEAAGLDTGLYFDTIVVSAPGAANSPQLVEVRLTVAEAAARIAVSQDSLGFSATAGGANPVPQLLTITNVGGGTLNWTTTPSDTWLAVDPLSGTAPSDVSVSVEIATLSPGTYTGTIEISSPAADNSPLVVGISLVVGDRPPELSVTPRALTFDGQDGAPDPPDQSFQIANTGGGLLFWSVSSTATWIALDPAAGAGGANVAVAISVAGLTAATYVDSIRVDAGAVAGSPTYVVVTLNLEPPPPPSIVLDPQLFGFTALLGGPNPAGQSLTITNGGGRTLTWSATNSVSWLMLSEVSGEAPSVVALTVDASSLSVGTYFDTVVVRADSADNSPQSAVVQLTIVDNPARIVLSGTRFVFDMYETGLNPPFQTLAVTNGGAGALNWSAATKAPWLTLTPPSGLAPSAIEISVSGTGLAPGTYRDTIVISSSEADNSPLQVIVTFVVRYAGGRPLEWTAANGSSWLSLSETSGTTPGAVNLQVDVEGLGPGTYYDTVVASSDSADNLPQVASVRLDVAATPQASRRAPVPAAVPAGDTAGAIVLSPTHFSFAAFVNGDNPPDQTLEILSVARPYIHPLPDTLRFFVAPGQVSDPQCTYVFVDGQGGRLVWRAHTDAEWISLDRDSCNISFPLCVTVDAAGRAAGVYCDSVEISGDATNSPQFLHVCMDVRAGGDAPVLAVSPGSVNVAAEAGPGSTYRVLEISNTGGGSLTYTIASARGSSWLSWAKLSGSAPDSVRATLTFDGLAAGVYLDTLIVSSVEAINSPQRVPVRLTLSTGPVETHAVRLGSATAMPGAQVAVPVYFDNPAPLLALSVPLFYAGADVVADSVSLAGSRISSPDSVFASIDTAAHVIRLGVINLAPSPIETGSGGLLAELWLTVAPGAVDQTIIVDTLTLANPRLVLEFIDTSRQVITPAFYPGAIIVGGGGRNAVWITDVQGKAGDEVTVEVQASNAQTIDRLILPLYLTSTDVSFERVDFTATRAGAGVPQFVVQDAQHALLDIDWNSSGLEPGSGPVARLTLALALQAVPQIAHVDTASECRYMVSAGGEPTLAPQFTRGVVYVDITSAVGDEPTVPHRFALWQNHPNPFNPSTRIDYVIAAGARSRLRVFNMLGQQVVTLVDRFHAPGRYTLYWDGRDESGRPVPTGTYLCRLDSGRHSARMKMTLMK